MACKEIIVCDRCASEIEEAPHTNIIIFEVNKGDGLDLCTRCTDQLIFWLNNRNSLAPPGYKLQPRPCPHHVPCADPNGCSGQELVPV